MCRGGDSDVVVTGIVGCAGLLPTVEAIKAGKDIALANKETLISGGPVILPLLKKHGVKMTPADSEHSAIFQSLQGVPPGGLKRIILTASGGAFRDIEAGELLRLCKEDPEWVRKKASTHPNWDMGAKITVDSATLMNKGLEVIEAHYLFGAGYDDIDVVIHPQSILHSAIETVDSSVIGQLGWPDMRLPLVYAMSWPHRLAMPYEPLDFAKLGSMTFLKPDREKYPSLDLSYAAGRTGGTMTAALNGANEQANEMFRNGEIGFRGIFDVGPLLLTGPFEPFEDLLRPPTEFSPSPLRSAQSPARPRAAAGCRHPFPLAGDRADDGGAQGGPQHGPLTRGHRRCRQVLRCAPPAVPPPYGCPPSVA